MIIHNFSWCSKYLLVYNMSIMTITPHERMGIAALAVAIILIAVAWISLSYWNSITASSPADGQNYVSQNSASAPTLGSGSSAQSVAAGTSASAASVAPASSAAQNAASGAASASASAAAGLDPIQGVYTNPF